MRPTHVAWAGVAHRLDQHDLPGEDEGAAGRDRRARAHPVAHGRVAQARARARRRGCVSASRKIGNSSNTKVGVEREVGAELVGREHRVDAARRPPNASRANSRAAQPPVGRGHQRGQRVQLDRPARDARHGCAAARGRRRSSRSTKLRGMNSSAPGRTRPARRRAPPARRAVAWFDGTSRPSWATWMSSCDDEKPSAPSRIAVAHQVLHRADLVGARGAHRGVVAHDEAAHRGVADVAAGVDRDATLEAAARSRRSRRPATHPGASASGDMPSTRLSICASHSMSSGRAGASVKPQLPVEHRGDAVPRRRRRERIPVELRVVVRVDVDEARRDDQPVGVDHAPRRTVDPPDARRCGRRAPRRRR